MKKIAILFCLLLQAQPAAVRAASLEQLVSEMYGADQARRLSAAGELLAQYPSDAPAEISRILKTPTAAFNEKFQLDLCILLAKRGDDASRDVILLKQKENSRRALWIVEESLVQSKNKDSITKLIPGMLTNLRPADRELGFYLVGNLAISMQKDIFVKALVQERGPEAFEQAIESAVLLSKKVKIASLLLANIDVVPSFDDRMAIATVVGKSGDTSCVQALVKMLADPAMRPFALEALSRMKQEDGLKDAAAILAPAATEPPGVPLRDHLRSTALYALLRYPVDRITSQLAMLINPTSAFLLDDFDQIIDSRIYLLKWMAEHPDPRFASILQPALGSESSLAHRHAIQKALSAVQGAAALSVMTSDAEKGDPEAIIGIAESGGETAQNTILAKLATLIDAGLPTNNQTSLACIAALGHFNTPSSIEMLARVVKLDLPPYSLEAVKQLSTLKAVEAQQAVVDALKSGVSDIRRAACIVIGASGTVANIKSLDSLQRRDPSSDVRLEARRAIDAIRNRSQKGHS